MVPSSRKVVLEAAPRPPARRRRAAPLVLRLVSVAGLLLSTVGTVTLFLNKGDSATAATPIGSSEPIAASTTQAPTGGTASQSPAVSPSPDPASIESETSGWTTCSNLYFGYELSYPSDWYTVVPSHKVECRFFDDRPFAITTDSESLPRAAIRIYQGARTYAGLARVLGKDSPDVLFHEDTTVDGHPAFRVEVMTHSDRYGDAPMYAYVIDLGGDALVLDSPEPFSARYADAKARLDALISTFHFLSGDAG